MLKNWNTPCGYRAALKVSLPLVASMASTTLMLFSDRLFLGWYSTDTLAASTPAGLLAFTLKDVYKKLMNPNLPEGIRKVYYTFTFHSYNETMQYSLLSQDKDSVENYVSESIQNIDGIIKAEIHQAERTKPFISYKEWQEYTSEGNNVPAWHHYMENHFDFVENEK